MTKFNRSVGYLDELEQEYEDPIAFFTAKAKKIDQVRLKENSNLTFTIAMGEVIATDSVNRKNFGYAALSKIIMTLVYIDF